MSTLNTAWTALVVSPPGDQQQNIRESAALVCGVWDTLLKTMELASIGPILEQITADLLKMLPLCK